MKNLTSIVRKLDYSLDETNVVLAFAYIDHKASVYFDQYASDEFSHKSIKENGHYYVNSANLLNCW